MHPIRIALFTAACLLLSAPLALAEPVAPGVRLPDLRLPDQHGEPRSVGADTKAVLFSRDMRGGGVLRDLLEKDGAAWLDQHRAVYVSDVSRMPGPIRAIIAMPRLRRRPYPVLLDESGEATASLPSADAKASVIFLDQLRVTRIEHVDSVEALRALFAPAAVQ